MLEQTHVWEEIFESLKKTLDTPQVLNPSLPGEILYIFQVVVEDERSIALIRESDSNQILVYFILKALAGEKMWYQKIEKASLMLVTVSHNPRRYFLAYFITVQMNLPLKQVLY